ncbi:segregation/condensation protein A [Ruminococcaceae bacterium OttesenSCG-928-I18]|nr:segregation/condensation protein A [Ruminococcaceae bacterium OttesenSCG-928-I18]
MEMTRTRQALAFYTEDFEGPLDLLLALVNKNKMKIYEIEILTLIDQYLEVVGEPGPDQLDGASEFITMAAHLVQMKSSLLLPKSEEGERMKEELTGLLVEYSACKEVAARLGEMQGDVFIAVRKPAPFTPDTTYLMLHEKEELAAALAQSMGRRNLRRSPKREQFDEIVAAPFVSVSGRVIHVLRGLVTGRVRRLRELFAKSRSRGETVATFLALLELVRGGRIVIDDEGSLSMRKGHETRKNRAARVAGDA